MQLTGADRVSLSSQIRRSSAVWVSSKVCATAPVCASTRTCFSIVAFSGAVTRTSQTSRVPPASPYRLGSYTKRSPGVASRSAESRPARPAIASAAAAPAASRETVGLGVQAARRQRLAAHREDLVVGGQVDDQLARQDRNPVHDLVRANGEAAARRRRHIIDGDLVPGDAEGISVLSQVADRSRGGRCVGADPGGRGDRSTRLGGDEDDLAGVVAAGHVGLGPEPLGGSGRRGEREQP